MADGCKPCSFCGKPNDAGRSHTMEEVAPFIARLRRQHQALVAAMVRRGAYQEAMAMLNDATRLPALWRWHTAGRLTPELLNELLREWWCSTYTTLSLDSWQVIELFDRAGFVSDAPLPRGRLTIYRGQRAEADVGVCWSLSEAVAAKFALHNTLRRTVVLSTTAERNAILGYLTERGDDEVIVDPDCLGDIQCKPLDERLRRLGERYQAEVTAELTAVEPGWVGSEAEG